MYICTYKYVHSCSQICVRTDTHICAIKANKHDLPCKSIGICFFWAGQKGLSHSPHIYMHSHAQGRRAPSEQQTPSGTITLNALVHRWLWPVLSLCVLTILRHPAQAQEMGAGRETCVGTVHSFTARMCAASRWEARLGDTAARLSFRRATGLHACRQRGPREPDVSAFWLISKNRSFPRVYCEQDESPPNTIWGGRKKEELMEYSDESPKNLFGSLSLQTPFWEMRIPGCIHEYLGHTPKQAS